MSRSLAVPLVLDRSAAAPLGSQVAGQLRDALVGGVLPVGARLPSTRALATDLGVSRSVTEQAFDQLAAEGWLETRRGSGTFVAAGAASSARHRPATPPRPDSGLLRLDTGTPWIDPRHRAAWHHA
jgi:GntR family transcriptional regulator / MocR family aminotransferase